MSTQPAINTAINIPTPVKPLTDSKSDEPLKREIWLDAFRAATWIVFMEELLASGEPRTAVDQFYDKLSDACWLARWKRENVVVDIEICAIPELISQLIPTDNQTVTTSYLEDMLATLTVRPFTNRASTPNTH